MARKISLDRDIDKLLSLLSF